MKRSLAPYLLCLGLSVCVTSAVVAQPGTTIITHEDPFVHALPDWVFSIAVVIEDRYFENTTGECGTFRNHVTYNVGGGTPQRITLGDLDGDGDLDAAVSNGSATVSVLLNLGDGSFAIQAVYNVGSWATGVSFGDFDNDEHPDMAVSSTFDGNVLVFLGNGDGTFALGSVIDVGEWPERIAVGDLDHDGDLDLVVGNFLDDTVSVLLGNGDATFEPGAIYSVGSFPLSATLGDLNDDGDLDLVIANRSDYNVGVMLGNGDGSFATQVVYSVGDWPMSIALADLDGDSNLDMVVANYHDANVSILFGAGDGTFDSDITYNTGNLARGVALDDLNQDGNVDIVVVNSFIDNTASVLINMGAGVFASQVVYVVGGNPLGIDLGDLDGDGDIDIATANAETDDISVLMNLCITDGPFPPFLQLDTPSTDLELQQGQQITISWLDDAQAGAEIRLYFDPDTGSAPWDEGGNNEIWIPFIIDASSPLNELTWHVSNLDPGTYSIWGKSDNGVHDPAYSRAPGLILVTEFTEDTEPEVDEDRIDLDTIPGLSYAKGGQGNNADHLYLVTHGWNGLSGHFNGHDWIEETANYVAAQPIGDQWDVAFLNWGLLAGEGIPLEIPSVLVRAAVIGSVLAELIEANGYTHIEVVAHSAGSWMAHTISKHYFVDLEVNVNLTLLDAVVPPLTSTILGQFADHTANFYDATIIALPFTQENLTSAFNVDLSCRHAQFSEGGLFPDHSTPWAWYRASAESADSTFIDDGTYCPDIPEVCFPLGFKMSKAYDSGKQWDLSAYPNDGSDASLFKLECGEPFASGGECTNNTSIFVLHSDTFDFTAMQSAVGDDGTVTIAADNVELTTGVETSWVGFDVPIDRAIAGVLFDVEFTSADPDAEGYATGYWVGAQLSGADERFADENTPSTSSFLFFETIPPGERVISFRLDANGGPTSSVRISNLRIGMFIEGDVNGDCVLSVDDFCEWVANPFDIDGNGVIDDQDQTLLAMALGVSEADENNNGIPDVCDCTGDLDGSGDVGVKDLLILLGAWGPNPGHPADFDGSGDVGVKDLLILLGNWGGWP